MIFFKSRLICKEHYPELVNGISSSRTFRREINEIRKTISDKKIDRRLYAVQLRGEGMTNHEIAEKSDSSAKMVSHWISAYVNGGINALLPQERIGQHRNLSIEGEAFRDLNREKYDNVRLMFQDEAGFGRINKPKNCWCQKGFRPSVPCHHIREFRYINGAVEPLTGEGFFLVMSYCNTDCMNFFLEELSKVFPRDMIILVTDIVNIS